MKYKRMIYFVSGAACLFLAAGLILYPILGNALAEKNKSLVMTEYSRAVEEMTDTRVAEILAAAEAYNVALSPISISADGAFSLTGLTAAQKQYDEILAINESGIMGQLEIPGLDPRHGRQHAGERRRASAGIVLSRRRKRDACRPDRSLRPLQRKDADRLGKDEGRRPVFSACAGPDAGV